MTESFTNLIIILNYDYCRSIKDGGTFVRPPSEFNGTLTAPGSGGGADAPFVAEAGRYHLFLSGVCPWASSVRATIELLQLQDMITVDVSDGQSGGGWIFYTRSKVEPWSLLREDPTFYLHEVYQASDPFCSARITVPVLWDCKTKTIVSNDSWDIVQMLSTAFLPLAAAAAVEGAPPPLVLCPPGEMEAMEALHVELKATLLNGVYRAGINLVRGNEEQAAKGRQDVFAALAKWDLFLGTKRFLMGDAITAVDLRLTMTLLRYDASYFAAFGLHLDDDEGGSHRGGILVGEGGYPHLCGYVRDVYQNGVGETVQWESFRQYYRWTVGHPADAALPPIPPIVASAEASCAERLTLG